MSRTTRPLLICATAAAMLLGGAVAPAAAGVARASSQTITPEDLLPDLQIEPLNDFRVQILDGRRILRFTSTIANLGDGPLELAATRSSTSTPDLAVVQHVYQPNGGYEPVPSTAVIRFSEDDRHRWNLTEAAGYTLEVPGEEAPRVTHAVDLCLTDETRLIGTAEARSYSCRAGRPDSRSVTEGLSVGWSTSNRSYFPDQRVDLGGLPLPGQYCVTATADPRKKLSEKTTENNAASSLLDITSNSVTVLTPGC